MKTMGPFVQIPCFLPELWSLNCLGKCFFLKKICAVLSKKPKSIIEICIYASEWSCYALLEKGIVYYTMTY